MFSLRSVSACPLAASVLLVAGCRGAVPAPAPAAGGAEPNSPASFVIQEAPEDFVQVSDTMSAAPDIEVMIAPYRMQMEEHLAERLGHADGDFFKDEPEGALENLVSDALLHVVQRLVSDSVHIVLMNDGGLRVPVAQGPILMRHVYELLPFENYVTVLTLTGAQLEQLADQVAETNGEPVAGWTMVLRDGAAEQVRVGGELIDPERAYRLATVDYLANGGGDWPVLWAPGEDAREDLPVLIRDVMIEYLREVGSVRPVLDGRIRLSGASRLSMRLQGFAPLPGSGKHFEKTR